MKPFKAGTVLKTMSRGRNKSVHLSLRFFCDSDRIGLKLRLNFNLQNENN